MIKLLITLALGAALFWWLAPRERARLGPVQISVPADAGALDDWAASSEEGVREGLARRIVWAVAPGQQTDLALVYLHGFSASPAEIAPVPQDVARDLGANLFLQRFAGHALDGDALGRVSAADWWRDTADAVAVGHRLGQRVVLIGTSTGATLAAEAARDPVLGPQIAGVVLISPNFGLRNAAARLLTWPLARYWAPLIAGRQRCFDPVNPRHAMAWTTCYPVIATLPVGALVAHARRGDWGGAGQPALFIWSDEDRVIDPVAARRIAGGWGGPVLIQTVTPGPADDPSAHVIAGDILSPGMTAQVSRMIADWLRALRAGQAD